MLQKQVAPYTYFNPFGCLQLSKLFSREEKNFRAPSLLGFYVGERAATSEG